MWTTRFLQTMEESFKDSNGIIVNTFSEAESHTVSALLARDDIPPVFNVGPLIDHKGKSVSGSDAVKRDEILKWLDDQPEKSVVFLCFGSGGGFGEDQLKETAIGLEKSGHRRDCPADFVKAEEITKAVKSMMEQGGELRNKAKEISEMAKKAVIEGGSAYVAFGDLIDQWLESKP
ncbi:hypothetical protein OIU76_021612 [Salix suchowensis]|nr:hypothetical protein OIU76_021612 [Salix suchowensis]